jgi:toxin ParE1/3/4
MEPSLALRAAAERDLREIAEYSFTTHGKKAKDAYLGDLRRAFDRLIDFPEIGAVRDDLNGEPRCLSCREHLIFYTYREGHISVLRILHRAMDVGRRL